jgi:hypothetical protein
MERKNKLPTRLEIEQSVHNIDPAVDMNSSMFRSGCIILASAFVGPNADRVAKFLECPRAPVRETARVLRKNKIWDGTQVRGNWFDPSDGGLDFILDWCVAEGLMNRAEDKSEAQGNS